MPMTATHMPALKMSPTTRHPGSETSATAMARDRWWAVFMFRMCRIVRFVSRKRASESSGGERSIGSALNESAGARRSKLPRHDMNATQLASTPRAGPSSQGDFDVGAAGRPAGEPGEEARHRGLEAVLPAKGLVGERDARLVVEDARGPLEPFASHPAARVA